VPEGQDLPERLDSVLDVLYAMFTEGHTANSGDALLRRDICEEAMRLGALLFRHPALAQSRVHALMALFHLHAARFETRADASGDLLLLAKHDRSEWDQGHIAAGVRHLARSTSGDAMTLYHLEAKLAACHTLARSWAETDWSRILELYDAIIAWTESPVVAPNRAIAVAEVAGALPRWARWRRPRDSRACVGMLLRSGAWGDAAAIGPVRRSTHPFRQGGGANGI
jgi:predicted RNA polymerase sigma factor